MSETDWPKILGWTLFIVGCLMFPPLLGIGLVVWIFSSVADAGSAVAEDLSEAAWADAEASGEGEKPEGMWNTSPEDPRDTATPTTCGACGLGYVIVEGGVTVRACSKCGAAG